MPLYTGRGSYYYDTTTSPCELFSAYIRCMHKRMSKFLTTNRNTFRFFCFFHSYVATKKPNSVAVYSLDFILKLKQGFVVEEPITYEIFTEDFACTIPHQRILYSILFSEPGNKRKSRMGKLTTSAD